MLQGGHLAFCRDRLSSQPFAHRLTEKVLAKAWKEVYFTKPVARVAQLAEHLVVAQGAVGSSPAPRPIFLSAFADFFLAWSVL